MDVSDIYLPLNHLFSAASKRAFKIEVKTLTRSRDKRVIDTTEYKVVDQVRFFGSKAIGQRQIFDAAQKVANLVNDYAAKGFVTGVMVKLILVQLATEPHELEQYLVLSYVALSPEGTDHLKRNPTNMEFAQGSVPAHTVEST